MSERTPQGHPPPQPTQGAALASYLLTVPLALLHGGSCLWDLPERGGCDEHGDRGPWGSRPSPCPALRSPGQRQDHPAGELGGTEAVPSGCAGDGEWRHWCVTPRLMEVCTP